VPVNEPFCSVIVPVYEHWHLVPQLIEAMQHQTYPRECHELLLIDNGSAHFDPPAALPVNAQVHCHQDGGAYAARNFGISIARGSWLAFTDADCRPRPDWLQCMMRRAQDTGPDTILAGAVEMFSCNRSPGWSEIHDLVRGIPQRWYVSRGYAATANLAVSARLAARLQGFDGRRRSGGDAEFCRRARHAGARIEYLPAARVGHPARQGWPEIAGKALRIKHAQLRHGSRRQRLHWRLRSFVPPLWVFARLAANRRWPLRYRLIAVIVQHRLWFVEMMEALKTGHSIHSRSGQ